MKKRDTQAVLTSEKLGKYYIEMKQNVNRPKESVHKLDEHDILLYKIPYTDKYDYYPVSIALYALGNFEEYLDTNNSTYKEVFLKQADWLVKNIKIKAKGFGIWEHDFVLPYYKFKIPWTHGMAQGLAISVLLRAYQLIGNKTYLKTAEQAYNTFKVDVKNGGVKFVDDDGNVWLEEYAISPPPHILNGFIYAVFGIYDFYRVTRNKAVLDLWKKEIETLEKNLEKYDTGYWSLYNLTQDQPATKLYHELHIEQLIILYRLTKKEIFSEYATRWGKYLRSPLNRTKVIIARGIAHMKQYGIIGSGKQYMLMRKWRRN